MEKLLEKVDVGFGDYCDECGFPFDTDELIGYKAPGYAFSVVCSSACAALYMTRMERKDREASLAAELAQAKSILRENEKGVGYSLWK